jgi:hypothetical protein
MAASDRMTFFGEMLCFFNSAEYISFEQHELQSTSKL